MNRISVKKIILIVALLSLVLSIFNTINFAYKSRDLLFNDSGGNGITMIHIRIMTNFDMNYIKDLTKNVTQQRQDRIHVELADSNDREVVIKMDYIAPNQKEELTDRLQQKYGNSVEILRVESMRNENPSESRRNIFMILAIQFIITIFLLIVCFKVFKRKKYLT